MNDTRMEINIEDYLALPIFAICVAVSVGLLDSTMMGYDLGATLVDLGSDSGFSVANVGAILTLAYVAYTNYWSMDMLSGVQLWLVVATVALVIAPPFLPVLSDTISQGPAALVAMLVQVGGFVTFSYVG